MGKQPENGKWQLWSQSETGFDWEVPILQIFIKKLRKLGIISKLLFKQIHKMLLQTSWFNMFDHL